VYPPMIFNLFSRNPSWDDLVKSMFTLYNFYMNPATSVMQMKL